MLTLAQSVRLYAQWRAAVRAKDRPAAAALQRRLDDAFYDLSPVIRTTSNHP